MQTTVATALPRMLGRHRRPAITHFGGERGQLAAPSAQQRVPARGVARASVIAVCGNAGAVAFIGGNPLQTDRSEEHTSELQSLMRISYAVFCLKKKI